MDDSLNGVMWVHFRSHAHGNKSRVGHEFWFKPPSDWYGYDTNVMNGLVSRVGHEFVQ